MSPKRLPMVTGYTSFGSNADRQHAAYSQPAGSLQSRLLGSSKRVLKHEKRAHAPGNAGTQRIRATGQNAFPILGKAHLALQQKRRSVMSAAFSTQLDVAGPTELQLSRLCSRLMGVSKWEKIYPCSNTDWLTNLEKKHFACHRIVRSECPNKFEDVEGKVGEANVPRTQRRYMISKTNSKSSPHPSQTIRVKVWGQTCPKIPRAKTSTVGKNHFE